MKSLALLLSAVYLLVPVPASSGNILTAGEVDGEIRTVYYSRSNDGLPYFPEAKGLAVGGYLGFTSHKKNNLSVRAALYTSQALYGDGNTLSATNLVNGEDGYYLLGKANIRYDDGINQIILGRQEMMTPLVYSDDARVVKDLFNAVKISTQILPEHTFHMLYLDSMSGMDNGHEKKDWINMSKTLNTSYNNGMYAFGVGNSSITNLNTSAWYYLIPDTVRMMFAGVKYEDNITDDFSITYEAHYWNSKSGSDYENDLSKIIDYDFSGIRVSVDIDDFTLQLAFDRMRKKAGSQTIHTYFGNYAEYTYGYLLGSGVYGAISTNDPDDDMTSMNAAKLTAQYHFSNNTFYIGYIMNQSGHESLQSDLDILDVALFMDSPFSTDLSLALIYENWNADGANFFIDNHLIRATVKHRL